MNKALHDYIRDRERTEALAAACDTKPIYLRHVALGHSKASPKLAMAIERHTDRQVTAASLRPDIWGEPAEQAAGQEQPQARAA
ncbi:MAG: helix-turn-helix domain-containing protein [Candidatus Accumulibacter sp.]|nr:helix-turn-helix domain-containing protein [Accumulibacter sp.]